MRFNFLRRSKNKTTNFAGGNAFAESDKLELAALLLTSTLKDQFYRSADASAARLKTLVLEQKDKRFAAQAAVYARNQAGMRSVTHLTAAEIAHYVKGESWTAPFYDRVVRRPDDVLEILAYYLSVYGRPLPNSLKKGLGSALARFDEYQLAKYRKSNAEVSLVDAVNLLHPRHTEALKKLVDGTLPPADTWETRLTQAGVAAESDDNLKDLKKNAWKELIESRKIGYFALLRNLRNILEVAPELADSVIVLLTDEKLIRKSLVLPFRFISALDALQNSNLPEVSSVIEAIGIAVEKSLQNVPTFEGRTLIALDGSGSMNGRPLKIGSLFAATLFKANKADIILFSDSAKYYFASKRDSTLSIAKYLESQAAAGGTNFHAIFQTASVPYDRIIILSDMQGWIGKDAPVKSFNGYCEEYNVRPKVFSFDLQGYGTLQFPQKDIFCLAGFSDKTLDTLRLLDRDANALIKEIEAVEL